MDGIERCRPRSISPLTLLNGTGGYDRLDLVEMPCWIALFERKRAVIKYTSHTFCKMRTC